MNVQDINAILEYLDSHLMRILLQCIRIGAANRFAKLEMFTYCILVPDCHCQKSLATCKDELA